MCTTRKEFPKFFPSRVIEWTPFENKLFVQESKWEISKVASLVKWKTIYQVYGVPLTLPLVATLSSADYLCKLDPDQARRFPDKMSDLIWIQTVWHSDGIPERFFWKSRFFKKNPQTTKKACKPAYKEFNYISSKTVLTVFNQFWHYCDVLWVVWAKSALDFIHRWTNNALWISCFLTLKALLTTTAAFFFIYVFFIENKSWHIMWIVCIADDSH